MAIPFWNHSRDFNMEGPALLVDSTIPLHVKKSKRLIWKKLFLISCGCFMINDPCAISSRLYNKVRNKDPFFPWSMILLASHDHRDDDWQGVHFPFYRIILILVLSCWVRWFGQDSVMLR